MNSDRKNSKIVLVMISWLRLPLSLFSLGESHQFSIWESTQKYTHRIYARDRDLPPSSFFWVWKESLDGNLTSMLIYWVLIAFPLSLVNRYVGTGSCLYCGYFDSTNLSNSIACLFQMLISPVLAALAVAIGVPILLFYVYGVVPGELTLDFLFIIQSRAPHGSLK